MQNLKFQSCYVLEPFKCHFFKKGFLYQPSSQNLLTQNPKWKHHNKIKNLFKINKFSVLKSFLDPKNQELMLWVPYIQ